MVCFCASALLLFALQAPQLPVAVTQSGVHIQSIEAEIGDLEIETPYGILRTPTDPVIGIIDGRPLALKLRKLRQDGDLDDIAWLQDLSTAGLLEELSHAGMELLALEPQSLEPYLLLENWGRRLDPVPASIARNKRIAWLWKSANGKDFTSAVMSGARLVDEVSISSTVSNDRVILLSDLRRSLRSRSPLRRRIAALVAGRQQEFSLREFLILASLEDSVFASRTAAASGAHSIHAYSARQFWVRNLTRGKEMHRYAAASHLGRHGGADGLNALIHVLAAWDHRTGDRFDFAGHRISVVSDRDRNALDISGFNPDEEEVDERYLAANRELLKFDSSFKVRRFGQGLQLSLLDALDLWAKESTARDADAWIQFYLEEWLPSQP